MTDEQKKWTKKKCDVLMYRAGNFCLTQNDWDNLVEMSNHFSIQAKGNPEVKSALLATLTYIEHMYKLRIME